MKITNGKDFWAGLMFIAFGLAFMIVARNYAMGNAVRMGPAYFPTVLGGMLAVLGAAIFFRGFASKISYPLVVFPFRFWFVLAGLALGVIAYYTQVPRDAGIVAQIGHELLSGLAIGLLFAAFGPRPLWIILFAVVVFGYLLKPIGLILATFILTVVSAEPGFSWTRKDFQMLPIYVAVGIVLAYLTLLVSPWIRQALLAVFGAIGLSLNATLVLIFVEIGSGAVLAFFAGRHKWPQATAGQITVLSYILAVFSVAAFVHGLGLPMNIWPAFLE